MGVFFRLDFYFLFYLLAVFHNFEFSLEGGMAVAFPSIEAKLGNNQGISQAQRQRALGLVGGGGGYGYHQGYPTEWAGEGVQGGELILDNLTWLRIQGGLEPLDGTVLLLYAHDPEGLEIKPYVTAGLSQGQTNQAQ